MTDRELMQMALDALEHLQTDIEWQYKSPTRAMLRKVEKTLRAALAEHEPEPVVCDCDATAWCAMYKKCHRKMLGLKPFVNSPQREWQGLTDEEVEEMALTTHAENPLFGLVHAIEAKLKEKNT